MSNPAPTPPSRPPGAVPLQPGGGLPPSVPPRGRSRGGTLRILRKIKTCLVLVFGIPCLILVLYVGISEYFQGEAELHLISPLASELAAELDGEALPLLAAAGHLELELPQGVHTVTLTRVDTGATATHGVELSSGFQRWAVPPPPPHCMVELEVSKVYYEGAKMKDGEPQLPTLEGRYVDSGPFEIEHQTAFSEEGLPDEISEGSDVHLFFEIPCSMMDASEEAIIQDFLGYTGWEKRSLMERVRGEE